jgi:hypothetical protein
LATPQSPSHTHKKWKEKLQKNIWPCARSEFCMHHVAHPSRKKGNKKLLAFYGVYIIILSSPRQCQIEKLFDREISISLWANK